MTNKEQTLWDRLENEQNKVKKLERQLERCINNRNEIVQELYKRGKSAILIGRYIGVSRQTIHKVVKEREG
tara:strand:+ start:432 stop:644 length:213 start_codon:yes stop_codon:yes gene_type:complete